LTGGESGNRDGDEDLVYLWFLLIPVLLIIGLVVYYINRDKWCTNKPKRSR